MNECSRIDLLELNLFYRHHSDGLLIDALGLDHKYSGHETLEELYGRLGLLRRIRAYSLKHHNELRAILIVNQSDQGLNLSELLNCIMIFVTEPAGVPWDILSIAICQLTNSYQLKKAPLLLYPADYASNQKVPFDKQYQLWILNVRHANEYMEYMKQEFRINF